MSAKGPQLNIGDYLPGTKYQVMRSLGAGGMGVVYQVVKPPNIQGVMKLMSTELAVHAEHRTRFFDEVRILAQLDHPNIVRVFDYDALADGTPFYVMELLVGRTVRDVIQTMGRVPPRVAYEITRQLLEALQAAHTHEVPVIHRDIKPENIFLHAPRHGEPMVKLIDFGVSAVADRKHDGMFVGTWSYAAPEQIRGETPTPATDLYAAGLVLYEMLAGVGPFDHHSDWVKVSEAQMRETPAPVSKFAPWVPTSIVELIEAALAKDPKARPRDAYAFAERLFELEWASDGVDARDRTMHGPSHDERMAQLRARLAAPRALPDAPFPEAERAPADQDEPGPLSRVLTSVNAAHPSSKRMAATTPAEDRLGDVPLIGVPPESVRTGPTLSGVGDCESTLPETEALLAGLDGAPGKLPPREAPAAPIHAAHAGRDAPPNASEDADDAARTLPRTRLPDAAENAHAGHAGGAKHDTFSTHESDARLGIPRPRPRAAVFAGAVAVCAIAAAGIF
ncbi:MAG TPA: serine/threonine-protein kinase, partial [Labilithrix sp.]|nr:serine/threonine-protein kinase [Labilithrix sp.]